MCSWSFFCPCIVILWEKRCFLGRFPNYLYLTILSVYVVSKHRFPEIGSNKHLFRLEFSGHLYLACLCKIHFNSLQNWKCFSILHEAKSLYIPVFVFGGKQNTESMSKSKSFIYIFLLFFKLASPLWSYPDSWVAVSLFSGQPCKAIGLCLQSSWWFHWFGGWVPNTVAMWGKITQQELVPPNIPVMKLSPKTCCSSLETATKLQWNHIKNEWRGLFYRLCPSCQWDDRVYIESWDSLNDKCPLMQVCKHHRKCVRR